MVRQISAAGLSAGFFTPVISRAMPATALITTDHQFRPTDVEAQQSCSHDDIVSLNPNPNDSEQGLPSYGRRRADAYRRRKDADAGACGDARRGFSQ
jgi:hypothetical protein